MSYDLTNPKLLKEWDKIKDNDVFPSLDAFAELFYQNPSCKCYRKYTSYPWSKENFFFGTYEEFLTYQRTTTEIPFYLASKIGTKVFNLTLLSFFRDENNKICAKCRCDCGNETTKTYDAILKGNARSCGCKKGGETKEEPSVYELLSDIIDEYWDFEKNIVSPKDIPLDSEEEYWWKGYAHSYKMPIQYLLRSVSGTSFPEQAIRFFLLKNDIEVINRHLITFDGKKYELDLFLPKLNIGIEYDGVFWHASKTKKDALKNKAVESAGITFVRVREKGLPKTKIKNGLEIMMQESVSNGSLANVINELFAYIESVAEIQLEKISPRDISKNKVLIQSQYSLSYVKNSVANSWLSEFWSEDNKEEPYFVSLKSDAGYKFKCPHGITFYCAPKYLMIKAKEMGGDPLSRCVFDYASLCGRESKVQGGLTVTVSEGKFFLNDFAEISFSVQNQNETAFDPLWLGQYSIFHNGKIRSFAGARGNVESTGNYCIDRPQKIICTPFRNLCLGKHDFELLPFQKKAYKLRLELRKSQGTADNIDIIASLNLLDQMNCVYKVCLRIKRFDGNISLSGKVLTWESYDSIIQKKNSRLNYILSEEEAIALFDEFDS